MPYVCVFVFLCVRHSQGVWLSGEQTSPPAEEGRGRVQ